MIHGGGNVRTFAVTAMGLEHAAKIRPQANEKALNYLLKALQIIVNLRIEGAIVIGLELVEAAANERWRFLTHQEHRLLNLHRGLVERLFMALRDEGINVVEQ